MTDFITLVERTYINEEHKYYKTIDLLSDKSKDLYNLCTYYYRKEERFITFVDLYHLIKDKKEYRNLPTKVSKQIIKNIATTWKSYYKSYNDYIKYPKKYLGEPKPPRYLNKETGRYLIIYPIDSLSIPSLRESTIKLSMSEVFLPTKVVDKIKEVRFVPRPKHYIMEVVYEKLINKIDNNPDILAAIDCGVNNLLIIATNQPIIQPIIINGKGIKSINRLYNKKLAEYKSKLKSGQFTSNSIINLTNKRNKRINSAIHKASSLVINYCKEYSISKIAIGYNSLWKHKVKLKSRVNQNFVQIPHLKLIEQIKYKAELIGVEVNIIEERYTSKCSALDLEPIKKNEGYVGERIYRGLFKTSTGLLINADWNGALNIGRKVFGNSFVLYLIGAKPISPKRINPI